MPIYEYQCAACSHEFEEWQKMSDKPVKKCPSCGAKKVERLVSVSSFHLKGGGWYRDGYGSSKSGGGPSKRSTSSTDSSSSSKSTGGAGSDSSGKGSSGKGSSGGGKASSSAASA